MKANNKIETILANLAKEPLNSSEFRVLCAWLVDANGFSAGRKLLAERTGIDPRNVYRAFTGLQKKGVLVFARVGASGRRHYILSPRLVAGADEALDEMIYGKKPVSNQTQPASNETQTSTPNETQTSASNETQTSASNETHQPHNNHSNNLVGGDDGGILSSEAGKVQATATAWIATAFAEKRDFVKLKEKIQALLVVFGDRLQAHHITKAVKLAVRVEKHRQAAVNEALAIFEVEKASEAAMPETAINWDDWHAEQSLKRYYERKKERGES